MTGSYANELRLYIASPLPLQIELRVSILSTCTRVASLKIRRHATPAKLHIDNYAQGQQRSLPYVIPSSTSATQMSLVLFPCSVDVGQRQRCCREVLRHFPTDLGVCRFGT